MPHYDVVILGAGPGGYVAAVRSAQLGLSTAVIEEKYWGGVCLNVGCIPSKALLRNADLAHTFHAKADLFGISGDVHFDFGVAWDRSREVAAGHVKGIHYLMKKNKITEYDGRGSFVDDHTIEVKTSEGGTETVTFDNAIIATGSTVRLLPGVSLSENVVTYEEQILTRELPKSIVIVGAGAIGMEFAYVLSNYGSIDADKVLMSIGFAPRVEGFGLDKTGVKLTDRGAIDIDDHMRTNVPHIYAIGDVTAKLQLAHVAEAQGVVAAETIGKAETMTLGDYRMMPRATFCSPQVASFGLTEAQARDAGYDVKVAKFPFSANGKANGLGEAVGFVKVIADGEHLELLGAHMIGPDVSELLPELTLAQKWDLTALEAARNVHTHPTLSEAVQEAFHGLAGHMINI